MNAINNPNKTLFLSYSRRQTDWCDNLYTAIDTYSTFYRWRDNKIPEGADWWDSICLNIEGCHAFVAILSQDYLDSVYCMGELDYAIKLNKPVIALMLQDVSYPQSLNEQRLQFARVDGLTMPAVMNKVLTACNQILLAYVQGEFSTDIHPRKHLRPQVPTPKASSLTPEEDVILSKQVDEVAEHGQIPTRDLMRRYGEEKARNIRLARDLLDKIAQRQDVPRFFKVDKEDEKLQLAEKKFAKQEQQRLRLKKISVEYEDLTHYVDTLTRHEAFAIIQEFMKDYPDFGDPQGLLQKFLPTSDSLLPKPFAWIDIPNKDYSISKYPITNAQFAKFIDTGGYQNQNWWTAEGWERCLEGWYFENEWKRSGTAWTEPRYWRDSKWNGHEQPVVGVSWFEAVAFCLWLSDVTGENIMLPTEDQWQYAAQGDDGRIYPWGNDWDGDLCNNNVDKKGVGKTTSVTQYKGRGDSPFGVVDMAGNVWEWCLTDHKNKADDVYSNASTRELRGGSWSDTITDTFTFDYLYVREPHYGFSHRGFRVCRFN